MSGSNWENNNRHKHTGEIINLIEDSGLFQDASGERRFAASRPGLEDKHWNWMDRYLCNQTVTHTNNRCSQAPQSILPSHPKTGHDAGKATEAAGA